MPLDEEQKDAPRPLKRIQAFGQEVPYYLLRFDKDGSGLSPQSAEHLITAIKTGGYSHVLLYSHGWNNDFPTATKRYDDFLAGLSDMAKTHGLLPPPFKPVFVGIIWPSTALTFGSEDGPDIAGIEDADALKYLLGALPEEKRAAAETMLAQPSVPIEDARLLAGWLSGVASSGTDGEVRDGTPDTDEIVWGWQLAMPAPAEPQAVDGFTGFGAARTGPVMPGGPQAAGWLSALDPRWIIRMATVLIMKDRAGVVGASGVADLVVRLLQETDARLFLFGHSYGCKVIMTALGKLGPAAMPRRKVDGALLLQPAVSRLCFAADLGDGKGTKGGFVRVLPLVERPILATYTSKDFPLTRIFHLVARRRLDPGELQMAAEASRFAALGGFGAAGCAPGSSVDVVLPKEGGWFGPLAAEVRVVSLNGSDSITGHGDVNRAETFWAALNLMK